MRTYWLSFADPARAAGSSFLGVCVVDVDEIDATIALAAHPKMYDKVEGPWIMAAARKAWELGCNPGGEVMSLWLRKPPDGLPRGRLLTQQELEFYGETQRKRP